jgi:integrase
MPMPTASSRRASRNASTDGYVAGDDTTTRECRQRPPRNRSRKLAKQPSWGCRRAEWKALTTVKATLPHKAGLRWHDLRHTAVALASDTGGHVSEIMARMGHASSATTIDRYGHLMPNSDARLAAALDGMFAGTVVPLRPAPRSRHCSTELSA